jgi:ABC-type branched-subunit amino acid transport system substrate-binding protein
MAIRGGEVERIIAAQTLSEAVDREVKTIFSKDSKERGREVEERTWHSAGAIASASAIATSIDSSNQWRKRCNAR